MALSASVLDAMLAAGCSAAQIVAAVKASEADQLAVEAARREKERLRKREQRAAKKAEISTVASDLSQGQHGTSGDGGDTPPFPDKEIPPTPPKETNPTPLISPQTGASAKFDQFWTEYPHKVGKADARRKFDAALKRTDFPSLMAGLRRYCAKTDDRPWCNPATWLHQERWDDAPAFVAEQRNRGSPPRGTGNGPVDFIEQLFQQAGSQNAAFSGNFETDSAPVIELSARRR